jgi:hypothetical protein
MGYVFSVINRYYCIMKSKIFSILVVLGFSCNEKEFVNSSKSNFCKVTRCAFQNSDTNYIHNYTWIENTQKGSDGSLNDYNSYGSVIRNIQAEDTFTYEYDDCDNYCKMTKQIYKGLDSTSVVNYTWAGDTQEIDGNILAIYNSNGYLLKSYRGMLPVTYKYEDCENFCKMISKSAHNSEVTYYWEGNTQKGSDGSIFEYNERGYLLRSTEYGNVYTNTYKNCN